MSRRQKLSEKYLPMVGEYIGRKAQEYLPIPESVGIKIDGGRFGRWLGNKVSSFLPFRKGGRVKMAFGGMTSNIVSPESYGGERIPFVMYADGGSVISPESYGRRPFNLKDYLESSSLKS